MLIGFVVLTREVDARKKGFWGIFAMGSYHQFGHRIRDRILFNAPRRNEQYTTSNIMDINALAKDKFYPTLEKCGKDAQIMGL